MKKAFLSPVLAILFSLSRPALALDPGQVAPPVQFLEEMARLDIEKETSWKHSCSTELPADFDQKWSDIVEFTKTQITNDIVRDLSRYAHEQMKTYEYHPSIMPAGFFITGCTNNQIVYSTRLDYLPTHHPLVTRYLEMFVVTHQESPLATLSRTQVYVTIRGHVEE